MRLKLYINAALIKGVADSNRENEKERKSKTRGKTKRNDEKDVVSETQVKPQAKCNRTSAQRPTRRRPPLAIYEKSSATDWLSSQKRNVDRHTRKSGLPDPRPFGANSTKSCRREKREEEEGGRERREDEENDEQEKKRIEAATDVRSAR